MHQTITVILREKREIEAVSMGVGTLWGYNLYQPPGCNPQTRTHKQVSIFVELADMRFRLVKPHDARPQRLLLGGPRLTVPGKLHDKKKYRYESTGTQTGENDRFRNEGYS
jgi:hypothetical protein